MVSEFPLRSLPRDPSSFHPVNIVLRLADDDKANYILVVLQNDAQQKRIVASSYPLRLRALACRHRQAVKTPAQTHTNSTHLFRSDLFLVLSFKVFHSLIITLSIRKYLGIITITWLMFVMQSKLARMG